MSYFTKKKKKDYKIYTKEITKTQVRPISRSVQQGNTNNFL